MMEKLVGRDNKSNRQFKPQIYQGKGRGQIDNFMIDTIMTSKTIKIDTGQIMETEEISIDKIGVGLGMNKTIVEEILEAIQEHTYILGDRIVEENTEITIRMKIIVEIEV